jgi:uncharacterized protein YlxW (UPF0749 family)
MTPPPTRDPSSPDIEPSLVSVLLEDVRKMREEQAENSGVLARLEASVNELKPIVKTHEEFMQQMQGALRAAKIVYGALGVAGGGGIWALVEQLMK